MSRNPKAVRHQAAHPQTHHAPNGRSEVQSMAPFRAIALAGQPRSSSPIYSHFVKGSSLSCFTSSTAPPSSPRSVSKAFGFIEMLDRTRCFCTRPGRASGGSDPGFGRTVRTEPFLRSLPPLVSSSVVHCGRVQSNREKSFMRPSIIDA